MEEVRLDGCRIGLVDPHGGPGADVVRVGGLGVLGHDNPFRVGLRRSARSPDRSCRPAGEADAVRTITADGN
ncbi:hypothetical protein ACE1SV_74390 [Streptomyces sennicomposti]